MYERLYRIVRGLTGSKRGLIQPRIGVGFLERLSPCAFGNYIECVATLGGSLPVVWRNGEEGNPTGDFKWRQTAPELIVCAVRWYLRYLLSIRDVEELLDERGLKADHTTVWRWVQRYGPELEQGLHRHLKPTINPGVLMKPMFGCRAAGATCIAPTMGALLSQTCNGRT